MTCGKNKINGWDYMVWKKHICLVNSKTHGPSPSFVHLRIKKKTIDLSFHLLRQQHYLHLRHVIASLQLLTVETKYVQFNNLNPSSTQGEKETTNGTPWLTSEKGSTVGRQIQCQQSFFLFFFLSFNFFFISLVLLLSLFFTINYHKGRGGGAAVIM
jgi:hypothetical protein